MPLRPNTVARVEPITGTPPVIGSDAPAQPLTHKVTLRNGSAVTVMDPKRPAAPWIFKEGETVKVPAHIATRLKEKSTDQVTVKVGTKISSQTMQKFDIQRIGEQTTADEPAQPSEEEVGSHGERLRE